MNSTDAVTRPTSLIDSHILVATGLILLVAALADFLFWGCEPGISVGIFFTLLGIGLFAVGRRTVTGGVALALLVASAAQSGIELCLTNIVVLVSLLLVLFGESSFSNIPAPWARWAEAAFAVVMSPLRWNTVLRRVGSTLVMN